MILILVSVLILYDRSVCLEQTKEKLDYVDVILSPTRNHSFSNSYTTYHSPNYPLLMYLMLIAGMAFI